MVSEAPTAVVFASFGTTYEDARTRCIDATAREVAAAFPGAELAQAYTSSIVRRTLARRGEDVPDVREALVAAAARGVRNVLVQPGHLMCGHEYDKLCGQVDACRGIFDHVRVGAPLLAGTDDVHMLVDVMAARHAQVPGRAVVLMGHGTDHFANVVYEAMNFYAHVLGRDDILVGTVEGKPTLATVMRLLARGDFASVHLAPLMLVAGDHATNDMAGDAPDSWASQLRGAGYAVTYELTGLGEFAPVRRMYVEHALAARG